MNPICRVCRPIRSSACASCLPASPQSRKYRPISLGIGGPLPRHPGVGSSRPTARPSKTPGRAGGARHQGHTRVASGHLAVAAAPLRSSAARQSDPSVNGSARSAVCPGPNGGQPGAGATRGQGVGGLPNPRSTRSMKVPGPCWPVPSRISCRRIRDETLLQDWGTACPHPSGHAHSCCSVCSPGNPTRRCHAPCRNGGNDVTGGDEHGFVIASDECCQRNLLPRRTATGRPGSGGWHRSHGFPQSGGIDRLSKRSNVPGMRSGFVAGDADPAKFCSTAPTTAAP